MAPILLITRPEPSGAAFADRLRTGVAGGLEVIQSPIMRIERCGALPDMEGIKTLIFTSRHGVEAYAALGGPVDIPAYAVGEATAVAARGAGLSVTVCDGDAASVLSRVLADDAAAPALHPHGEHMARDIAKDLTEAGIETHDVVLYRQVPVHLTDRAKAVLAGDRPVVVPLFSPRSARLFFDGAHVEAPLLVAAISEAAARAVPEGSVRALEIASRPDQEAMVEVTKGLLDAAKRLEGDRPAK